MAELTIDDKNKLIAEFEGAQVNFGYNKQSVLHLGVHINVKELGYNASWNWLMPACKKFDSLDLVDENYVKHCDNIDFLVSQYEIEPVYEALVQAILWYNEFIK